MQIYLSGIFCFQCMALRFTWLYKILINRDACPRISETCDGLSYVQAKHIVAQNPTVAPFTRYRFHFISDCHPQSDMKNLFFDTIPFSFYVGFGFCLHDAVFVSCRIALLFPRENFAVHCNSFTACFLHPPSVLHSTPR